MCRRKGSRRLIDVFEGGKFRCREDAEKMVRELTGEAALESQHFEAVTERQILQRILLNLIGNAQQPQKGPDREALIRYESRDAGARSHARSRPRPACRLSLGNGPHCVPPSPICKYILDAKPEGIDLEELRNMQQYFRTNKPPR